jgi:hypothetical protein
MRATVTESQIKPVAIHKKREGRFARAKKRREKNGGANVIWKRITAAFDDELKKFGANPAMVAPLSRWVIFKHISKTQAAGGRYYASIVRRWERYCLPFRMRTARSANLEPHPGIDDELERVHAHDGIWEYEADARAAKRQYRRAMKVLDKFIDPITGRNIAKDTLDMLVLYDEEPPSNLRQDLGVVLTAMAKEFGLGDYHKAREDRP